MTDQQTNRWPDAAHAMLAFITVLDEGSFAMAALRLDATPSAISKAVSRLEARLGVRLLNRTTRRLDLTEEGRVFERHARVVLDAIDIAEAEVAALAREPSGRLRVSLGSAYAKHRLVRRLPAFCATYPKIHVELNVTDDIIDPRDGTTDIAIRPLAIDTEAPDPDLHTVTLDHAVRHICAAPAYLAAHGEPASPADLAYHDCMVMSVGPRFARWPFRSPADGTRSHVQVSGSVVADNADMLLDLALAGHGIVRLLDTIVGAALARGDLVSILTDYHVADRLVMRAMVKRGAHLRPRIAAFLAFMQNNQPNCQGFGQPPRKADPGVNS